MELPLTEMGEIMEKTAFDLLGKVIAYLYAFENDSVDSKNTDEGERKENYFSYILR